MREPLSIIPTVFTERTIPWRVPRLNHHEMPSMRIRNGGELRVLLALRYARADAAAGDQT